MPESQATSWTFPAHCVPPRNARKLDCVPIVARTHPGHGKLLRNAWKSSYVPTVARTCLGHDLHTVLENCPEMLENQAASQLWPRRIPYMAYTPCLKSYLEMPESQATSWTFPALHAHKQPRNA
ncbi:Hypothetical predicted protein [Olea europaea subsp. europaea]|uniref:Uncharacterized protein n=1 Tax=Olea europaea subsp. europaea TaxID=158383 RepID=A0A8S0T8Z5_OLEEU|nr:Hypothetical predicted protein [Olea europaea subsp. europaea]